MVHGPIGVVLVQVGTGRVNLRPRYRVRQFLGALGWGAKPVEDAVLRRHLNAAQIVLFRSMSVAEQRHSYAVLRTLHTAGYEISSPFSPSLGSGTEYRNRDSAQAIVVEPALAQAALLHDVGKVGGRIELWHRVVTVLLSLLCPALLRRLAFHEPHSWRYPFFVLLHHAERGADLAAEAGTDSMAVGLIRAHHSTPEQSGLDAPGHALLAALLWADGEN